VVSIAATSPGWDLVLGEPKTPGVDPAYPALGDLQAAADVVVREASYGPEVERITPIRLAAAAQAALGHPISPGLLSPHEEALIGGDLCPTGYRQQIGPNLVRLDASHGSATPVAHNF
jgi:hypothetical protein